MKYRIVALLLVLCCLLGALSGCGMMGEVANAAIEAAKTELENQIRTKLEEQKITVVESKSAFGSLNDEGGKYQFFYAVLIRANTEDTAAGCADALSKAFGNAGYTAQTGPEFSNEHLVHKTITFDHGDYSAGDYYAVYLYLPDLTGWIEKIPEITFPTVAR